MALAAGAGLVLNTDGHAPDDLITDDQARNIALGAGLEEKDFLQITRNAESLVKRLQ
jgi:histidinol phosphatase-like PHP family hydrolase